MLPIVFAAGATSVVAGVALIFLPAALICAGILLMLTAYGVAKAQETRP